MFGRRERYFETLSKSILENNFDAIVIVDVNSKIIDWNASAEALLGWSKFEVLDKDATDFFIPKRYSSKHKLGMKLYLKTGKEKILNRELTLPAVHKDGRELNVLIKIVPVVVKLNKVFVATVRDLSEKEKQATERIEYSRQLNGRIKTTMSIMQAITKQTLLESSPEDVGALLSRLFAMEKALNLLYQTNWYSVNLYALVYDTTYLYAMQNRFSIQGDQSFQLQGNAAISFALIVHELSTNSIKYGALEKGLKGKVKINWFIKDGSLVWSWSEIGGPKVEPPHEIGFGIQFIKRAFTGQGTTIIEYPETGLVCTIVLKLDQEDN